VVQVTSILDSEIRQAFWSRQNRQPFWQGLVAWTFNKDLSKPATFHNKNQAVTNQLAVDLTCPSFGSFCFASS
jgi:hypothetical protein